MESLLEPVELNRETTQALDEIRSGAENALYGTASADAEEKVNRYVLPLIEGSGLPNLHVMHYRWYLRELARHWRTRKGRDLAFHLELCIRKWVGLGLEPRTLQFLVCEAHQRLKGKSEGRSGNDECRTGTADADLTTKSQRHEDDGESGALDCGSELSDRGAGPTPAFPARTDGPEKAAAPLPHSIELRSQSVESVDDPPESADVRPGHSIPRSLDPSIPSGSHSIPRSLDPSIPCSTTPSKLSTDEQERR